MRLPLTLIAAAALLCACDVVTSREPLFTKADTLGAPGLRDGVWLLDSEETCKFDSRRPVVAWPECAHWIRMRSNEVLGWDNVDKQWEVAPLIFAAGDPRILQVHPQPGAEYAYMVLRAANFNASGRITAYRAGWIHCSPDSQPGPVQKKEEAEAEAAEAEPVALDAKQTPVERQAPAVVPTIPDEPIKKPTPFPGFIRENDEGGCITHSADALRNAARAMTTDQMAYLRAAREDLRKAGKPEADIQKKLEALALPLSAHWVRDITPRDRVPKARNQ